MLCSNNTKSYYNRIVHLIASIALQHLGMPIEPITSIFKIIQEMDYYVGIAYGILNSKINGTKTDILN